MHSCGSTRKLMPRFIEMGLDILDAVQPEPAGMNPEEVKREFGDRLAFCGMISTQHTLPHGTEAECRAEARHRIDVIGTGGGYIFSPAHCHSTDTPLGNVLAIYEEALTRRGVSRGGLACCNGRRNAHERLSGVCGNVRLDPAGAFSEGGTSSKTGTGCFWASRWWHVLASMVPFAIIAADVLCGIFLPFMKMRGGRLNSAPCSKG